MYAWIRLRLWMRGARDVKAKSYDFGSRDLGELGSIYVEFTNYAGNRVFIAFATSSAAKAERIAKKLNVSTP